jgi:hypothetical protein
VQTLDEDAARRDAERHATALIGRAESGR